jgi:hypothetical protein
MPNICSHHHGTDGYRYLLADLNDTLSFTLGYRDVDPGSRRAKSMGIHADPDPQHCQKQIGTGTQTDTVHTQQRKFARCWQEFCHVQLIVT